MRRGRPRYNDVLTPREWEVLSLVRDGLTNEQIAGRLNISLATAKFHVAEIMGKLGAENRREAARWQGRPRVAFGLAPVAVLLGKLKGVSPLRLAGGMALGVAAVALVALAFGVMLMESRATPQEAAAPSVSPEPTPVEEGLARTDPIAQIPPSAAPLATEGSCFAASSLVASGDAWRCVTALGTQDPCFGAPGSLEVVCPGRPDGMDASVVSLAQPLPVGTPLPGVPDREPASTLGVMTADGRLCRPAPAGTAPVVNGEAIGYICGDGETGLLGVQTSEDASLAREVPLRRDGTVVPETIVELRMVWR